LGDEGPATFVDAAIPDVIRNLLLMLPSDAEVAASNDAISGAAEEVALDLLEGIDNILKRLAERVVATQNLAANGVSASSDAFATVWHSKTLKEGHEAYTTAFKKQFPKTMGKMGKEHAEHILRVAVMGLVGLILIVVGMPMAGAGAVVATGASAPLLKKFKWVRDLMKRFSGEG
jgi:hypothetical protein